MNRPRWLVPVVVIGAVVLVIVIGLVGSYNGLVNKDSDVDKAAGDLNTALQRRFDLIPNLVGAVRGAQIQEEKVLGDIANARTKYAGARSPNDKVAAGNELETGLGRLLAVIENYPQLKSNDTVLNLQTQLEGTENRVAQARRDYNAVTTDYNKAVRRFPRSIIAGMFGFNRRPLFEVSTPAARQAPPVNFENRPSTTVTSLP